MADVVLLDLPSLIVSPANGLEVVASFERHDLGVRAQYDRRGLFDPANSPRSSFFGAIPSYSLLLHGFISVYFP
jgi:hypothetical protein